jgi:hypothetical protein
MTQRRCAAIASFSGASFGVPSMTTKPREFDGYLASADLLFVGQVLFIGPVPVSVKKVFESKEAWELARRTIKPGVKYDPSLNDKGEIMAGLRGPRREPEWSQAPDAPPDAAFFYGVDYYVNH